MCAHVYLVRVKVCAYLHVWPSVAKPINTKQAICPQQNDRARGGTECLVLRPRNRATEGFRAAIHPPTPAATPIHPPIISL